MKIFEILLKTYGSSLVNELDDVSYKLLAELRNSPAPDRYDSIRELIEVAEGIIIWIILADSESRCVHLEKRVNKCRELFSKISQ